MQILKSLLNMHVMGIYDSAIKKSIHLVIALLTVTTALAQSDQGRFGIYLGGGSQRYNGDLGNGFNFKQNTWRGGFTGSAMYAIDKNFDIGVVGYIGDLGFCQSDAVAQKEVPMEDRCGGGGCIGRVGLGNISSRMVSAGFSVKYKLHNRIFKEKSKLLPFVHFGATYNRITDKMKMNCVNVGRYYSINSGAGITYSFSKNFDVGYVATLGYFTSDRIDYMLHGRNDMYLQNNIVFGFHL